VRNGGRPEGTECVVSTLRRVRERVPTYVDPGSRSTVRQGLTNLTYPSRPNPLLVQLAITALGRNNNSLRPSPPRPCTRRSSACMCASSRHLHGISVEPSAKGGEQRGVAIWRRGMVARGTVPGRQPRHGQRPLLQWRLRSPQHEPRSDRSTRACQTPDLLGRRSEGV
jgi:hypothetical protein